MNHWILAYCLIGVVFAFAARFILSRQKIDAEGFWASIVVGFIESPIASTLLWPIVLLATVAFYVFEHLARRSRVQWLETERIQKQREKENPFLALPLDKLLKKVDEEKRTRQ